MPVEHLLNSVPGYSIGRCAWVESCRLVTLIIAFWVSAWAPVLASAEEPLELTIMSYNLWGAGANQGKPIDTTLRVLQTVDADIIGLQESRAEAIPCGSSWCPPDGPERAIALAETLGYHVYVQKPVNDALWANAVLSRYPIIGVSPNQLGVRLDIAGRTAVLFNLHPTDYPYPPYQLLRIPYGAQPDIETAEQAQRYASRARGKALTLLLNELTFAGGADLVLLTGDFNEPSHLDWTASAAEAGIHPLSVRWPFSAALENAGFVDTFRKVHPDELANPGFTWSPGVTIATIDDHPDRIDFVYVRSDQVEIIDSRVVGEHESVAGVVVSPWPSDHRAVVTKIRLRQP